MEVAERCEVILAHQDVRVPQVRQVLRLGVQFVLEALRRNRQSEKRDTERTENEFILSFFFFSKTGRQAHDRWWTSAKQNCGAASTLHFLICCQDNSIIIFYSADDGRGTSAFSLGEDQIQTFCRHTRVHEILSCSLMLTDPAEYLLTHASRTNSTPTFL